MAEKKTFPLRLQQQLFDAIQKIAEQEFRSVNGQMEKILSEYVNHRMAKGSPSSQQGEPSE